MAEPNGQSYNDERDADRWVVKYPPFSFTSDARFPNKIKLRKKYEFWPLVVTLGGDYDLIREQFQPRFTLKDAILKGRICLEPAKNTIGYRKTISAPLAGRLDFHAEVCYQGDLNPKWGIQYHMGGSCKLERASSLFLKQKLRLGKTFGVELCGRLRWPMPIAALRHESGENECTVGEGTCNFNLSEANALIRL